MDTNSLEVGNHRPCQEGLIGKGRGGVFEVTREGRRSETGLDPAALVSAVSRGHLLGEGSWAIWLKRWEGARSQR